MDSNQILKNNQEIAVAAWVNFINNCRIEKLNYELLTQDFNYANALKQMRWAEININDLIIKNRGGDRGLHGFIAEVLETGVHNARRAINGQSINMTWCNNNESVDLIRDGVGIQQKFYQDGLFSLKAAARHLEQYPYFLIWGKKYQIPKDQYETVRFLLSLNEKEAYRQLNGS